MPDKVPVCHCLSCGYLFEDATVTSGHKKLPKPGDLSICLKCGAVAKFGPDLRVIPFSSAEIEDIQSDLETMNYLSKVIHTIRFVRASSN